MLHLQSKLQTPNGTSVTLTENDFLPKNNVFVDTISPSIELVGSANYIIPYGTLDPSIPNVTVSDGDPNYLSGFTLVKSPSRYTILERFYLQRFLYVHCKPRQIWIMQVCRL